VRATDFESLLFMLTRAFSLKTDFTTEILGSLVRFYNIKLEYPIFSSSDAFILPEALLPSMSCLIFDRLIPQLNDTSTPTPKYYIFCSFYNGF
jgi:hypothetical protein